MKNCLLLLVVVAMVAVVAPAYSQTLYMDTNGDGLNSLIEHANGNPRSERRSQRQHDLGRHLLTRTTR